MDRYQSKINTGETLPWIEKYRPKKLDDLIQDEKLLTLFKNNIKTGEMSHLLFYGLPGTGKTSAILALGRELFKEYFKERVIEFNASDDRGINAVREKISNEAKKYVSEARCQDGSTIPSYKLIILDEADAMTDEAQDALRVIIEQYSGSTRFCFICNYISKITDAIKSRCSIVYFKRLDNDSIINRLEDITKVEGMKLTKNIYQTIVEISRGDMRKAIMILQNVKYLYHFKKLVRKPLKDLTLNELKITFHCYDGKSLANEEITEEEIYNISTYIVPEKAKEIILQTLKIKRIHKLTKLVREIINLGYPIDNVILQLNQAILKCEEMNDTQKAQFFIQTGEIFYKLKECSNEYIQLLHYLSLLSHFKN
jgi:replication factor C subunit 2/4